MSHPALASLAIVARHHGKAFVAEDLRRELGFGPRVSASDLLAAARWLGFRAVLDSLDLRCVSVPLPCIVELQPGGEFAAITRIEARRVLIEGNGPAQRLRLEELHGRLSGLVLVVDVPPVAPRLKLRRLVPAIARQRRQRAANWQ